MGRRCCIPSCRSNNTETYLGAFTFPKDKARRALWLKSINHPTFEPSARDVVCVRHFDEKFVIREHRLMQADGTFLVVARRKLMLTHDAYPTIFPDQPQYLTAELSSKRNSPSQCLQEIIDEDEEEYLQWCAEDDIPSFEQFTKKFSTSLRDDWISIIRDDFVLCYQIDDSDCPKITVCIRIFKDFTLEVWRSGSPIDIKSLEWVLGADFKCDKWTKFDCLISNLVPYELNDF